jgi:hypothetical protein
VHVRKISKYSLLLLQSSPESRARPSSPKGRLSRRRASLVDPSTRFRNISTDMIFSAGAGAGSLLCPRAHLGRLGDPSLAATTKSATKFPRLVVKSSSRQIRACNTDIFYEIISYDAGVPAVGATQWPHCTALCSREAGRGAATGKRNVYKTLHRGDVYTVYTCRGAR